VPVQEFERAHKLMVEWNSAGDIPGLIRCPECHSLRVDYPQFTPKSLLTNVAMGLAAQLHVIQKEYYCEDCHFTWPKEGTKRSAARPHMAPYYFIEGVVQANHESRPESHKQAA
jgi:hypothetical protein